MGEIDNPEAMEVATDYLVVDPVAPANRVADAAARPRRLPRAPANGLARSLEKRRLQAYLGMVATDAVLLLACFGLVALVHLGRGGDMVPVRGGMQSAYLLLPLYLTIALYNGTYSRSALTDW